MKARVKATGEIVEVTRIVDRYVMTHHPHTITFEKDELDFDIEDDPDYWTRLEHQYAGMAMQGMLSNTSLMSMLFDATKDHDELLKEVIICSHEYAHALVEKMKEERK